MKKRLKKITGFVLCLTLVAVVAGAGVFFAQYYLRKFEAEVTARDTIKLSTVVEVKGKEDIVLCAHRGFSAVAPENSLAAIAEAGAAMFSRVEFDVRETRDGVLVLMHDATVNRMTDGAGKVASRTFKRLLTYKFNNGANFEEYGRLGIPTLSEALTVCVEHNMTPVMELKSVSGRGLESLKKTLDGLEIAEYVIVASSKGKTLLKFREMSPETEIWLMTEKIDRRAIRFCGEQENAALSFNAHSEYNKDDVIRGALKRGVRLSCWTVNDRETLARMAGLGIREFITDVFEPHITENGFQVG
ncbi:MAG: hypothetical protein FWF05_01330 [Oscillospiraceae bacterium]|nr:hypothetical protein [Oscillospiraceae bacterium]